MKKCVLTFIISMLIIILPLAAAADESDRMPDIDNIKKSLTIDFYVQNNEKEVPISGAEISIYKVADLTCENGSAEYTLLSQYESLRKCADGRDVTFDGMTVSESTELSKKLAVLVTDAYAVGITDIAGEYTFKDLSQGMYLVIESNAYDEAAEYEIIAPYLVSVPLAVKDNNGNYWKNDVISQPKTKIEAKSTDEPSTEEAASDEPATDEPESDEPESDEPTTELPATDESTVSTQSDVSSDVTDKTSSVTSVNSVTSAAEVTDSSNPVLTFFDISKVKTGFVSNITVFLMIMFASSFFIVILAGKKKGEDDDEKN